MLTPEANTRLKRAILMGEPLLSSQSVYLGLLKHMVDHSKNGPVEVEYSTYKRQQILFTEVSSLPTWNVNTIRIPTPPADQGAETIMDFGIYDQEEGGMCWFTSRFMKEGFPHAVVLTHQAPLIFMPESIAVDFG